MIRARWTGAARSACAVALLLAVAGCGLPVSGSPRAVDDATVPYGLLDPEEPSAVVAPTDAPPDSVPLVFWLDDTQVLVPVAARSSCSGPPGAVVEMLLDLLAAGPSDEVRAGGWTTAIPPESDLALVGISDGTAEVALDVESDISAELLPFALGQVVLSAASAPGIDAVALVRDGERVPIPLPGGALTSSPVTPADYATLLVEGLGGPGSGDAPSTRPSGCPRP